MAKTPHRLPSENKVYTYNNVSMWGGGFMWEGNSGIIKDRFIIILDKYQTDEYMYTEFIV